MKLCKYFDVTPNNVLELKNIRKLSNGSSKNTCRTNKGNAITETTQVIVNTIYCALKPLENCLAIVDQLFLVCLIST